MATKRTSGSDQKKENLPSKRVMRTVLSVGEVAWSDGGRAAAYHTGEQKSAVKKLAAAGYMKLNHVHRDEVTAALTVKGHLLLLALRGGA